MAYWFKTDDGTKYGLNGLASEEAGFAEIEPIWALNEKLMAEFRRFDETGDEVPVLRISIGDLISEAEKVCPD